ncbi:MAG: HAD family hydrolase [Solobacterium sp.]|nr:HAD family hydrolase [Solobacterium sp.]
MQAILFDLDGTLLPMDNDDFIRVYFGYLAKAAYGWGYTDSKHLVDSIWKGVYAMYGNDGKRTNDLVFWDVFRKEMDRDLTGIEEHFSHFYLHEFDQAKEAVTPAPLAKEVIQAAHAKADKVILATNALFPMEAYVTRLSWIGLKIDDVDDITDYTRYSYCKPDPRYFKEILERHHLDAEECLVIGNDMDEDVMAAAGAGIRSFLVTDYLINRKNRPVECPNGTYADMLAYILAEE